MITKKSTSHRCCQASLVETNLLKGTTVLSGSIQESKDESNAASNNRKSGRSILVNGSLIAACLIGVTIICVGLAALAAIDGSAAMDRPTFLSKVPLTILLSISVLVGVGIVYLMVQVLLAMSDDFGDYR